MHQIQERTVREEPCKDKFHTQKKIYSKGEQRNEALAGSRYRVKCQVGVQDLSHCTLMGKIPWWGWNMHSGGGPGKGGVNCKTKFLSTRGSLETCAQVKGVVS